MGWFVPALIGAAGALGVSAAATKKNDTMEMAPEYPEAEGARKSWWSRLQEWGDQPGYGAISPDWGDIWDRSKRRVNQYYWGSAVEPGMVNKVRSSLARRNMSDSPASEDLIARMGIQEGQQLQDLSTEQALQEATFSEQGRQNWLQSLMTLAGMKPNTYMKPADNTMSNVLGALSGVASAGASYGMANDQMNWMQKLFGNNAAQVGSMGSVPVAPSNYYRANSQPLTGIPWMGR